MYGANEILYSVYDCLQRAMCVLFCIAYHVLRMKKIVNQY